MATKQKSGSRSVVQIEGLEELEAKLDRMRGKAGEVLRPGVQAGGETWRDEARRLAPGPHVEMEVESLSEQAVATIGPDKSHFYYMFFETGAQAHEIKVKNRKALKFKLGDEVVFLKRVQHTGIGAQPFLKPPFVNRRQAIVYQVGKVWKRATEV